MDIDPANTAGLPAVISMGIGVFFAVGAALNKWLDSQKNETTQVSILREDRDSWRARAEKAELDKRDVWDRLNKLIIEQSDSKAQLVLLTEQLKTTTEQLTMLRQENAELKTQMANFMRLQNARPNSQSVG